MTLFDLEKHIDFTPQQRYNRLLSQNNVLFLNLTVLQDRQPEPKCEENKAKREIAARIILWIFELNDPYSHGTQPLSCGQQQGAHERILVFTPGILLLYKSIFVLNRHLRFRLEQEMRAIIHRIGKTANLVSYNDDEVFCLLDKKAAMHDGDREIFGSTWKTSANPTTSIAAILTSCKNVSQTKNLDSNSINAACLIARMHFIRQEGGNNRLLCRVDKDINPLYSYMVIDKSRTGEADSSRRWEIEKDDQRTLRECPIMISFPQECLGVLGG